MNYSKLLIFVTLIVLLALLETTDAIRCYKCNGDDECDFRSRQIYIDNCTWATKCWGARIGEHYIRGCADDRCDLQVGVGSFIESKCCYDDLCNHDHFFYPSAAERGPKPLTMVLLAALVLAVFFAFRRCGNCCS